MSVHAKSPADAADLRALPAYAAGEIEVPWVIGTFHERIARRTVWAEHSHPTHELIRTHRGISTVRVGRRTWTITPALGLWMPAGVLHSGTAPADTEYRTSHFDIAAVAGAVGAADAPVTIAITPLLRLLLDRLDGDGDGDRDHNGDGNGDGDADRRALAPSSRSLTEAMVLDVLEPSPRELLVTRPAAPVLAPIVAALDADPGDARTLADWARRLGVSSRTLTRALRAETGQGFAQWQGAVRTQRAADLLADGVPIAEVVEAVGYTSASAFGAAFRRATGLTPREFRSACP